MPWPFTQVEIIQADQEYFGLIILARPSFIGPAGPQVIQGTVNEPVKFPEPSESSRDLVQDVL